MEAWTIIENSYSLCSSNVLGFENWRNSCFNIHIVHVKSLATHANNAEIDLIVMNGEMAHAYVYIYAGIWQCCEIAD